MATLTILYSVSLLCVPQVSLAAEPIKAGIYQNEPKIFVDANGDPAGFFVDLLNAVAQAEGWKLQYVACSWVECLTRLERGEIDLMADVAYTSEREKRFDFGREVTFASWSVVYAKPDRGIRSVLDLDGKKVVVLRDSVQAQVLRALTESFAISPQFVEVDTFDKGYRLVEDEAADCIAVNRFFGKLHESIYSARPTSILIAPALVKFAAPKGRRSSILQALDRHLVAFKADGDSAYYKAFDRWFEPSKTISLPGWLKWGLAGTGFIVVLLVGLTFVFRRMVGRKTLELEQSKSYLERLSYYDPLTRLPNRVLLIDRLEQAARQTRDGVSRMAVLFVDLDEFKQINDSVGHDAGDEVLELTAQRFTACVRKEDTVARLGGDEFTVLIRAPQDATHVAAVAQKLIAALRDPFNVAGHSFYLSASVGIALLPQDGTDAQELLRNADAAMYRAKEEGRNTFRFYTQEMTDRAFERISLVTGLREGLERNEFFLHYQPLFNLETQCVVGVEALVRWKHGSTGLIAPDKFIPIAEESGAIFPIGERVLREACVQMVKLRDSGLAPGRMAVNLSGKQIQRGDVVKTIARVLDETGCPASLIELEVTESFIMTTPDISIPVMRELREMGLELAIDDFGTGHSSLAYLKELPVSKLKIDRSFVRDVDTDPNDAAIVRAVIALGDSLDLTVLAEGIETKEQLDLLCLEGCDEGQGYLLGRPVPEPEMWERLSFAAAESASTGEMARD